MQHAPLEVVRRRFALELRRQHRVKNLEPARPVNEGAARLRDDRQTDRERVAVARIVVVQKKSRIEPARKIEQLPDRHARLARVVAPGRDCVGHAFVEAQQPFLRGGERREIPERLRAAVDFTRAMRRAAARIILDQRFSVLNDEQRQAISRSGKSRRRAEIRRVEIAGPGAAGEQQTRRILRIARATSSRTAINLPRRAAPGTPRRCRRSRACASHSHSRAAAPSARAHRPRTDRASPRDGTNGRRCGGDDARPC